MSWFNKQRTDGQTYDGQGEERRGFIDVVQYNGEADDLLWRFPFDNLSTKTRVVVQEGQEAVFFSGGRMADILGPNTHTLSTGNIPLLQKIVNLPFGGESPFKATVCYVNKTVRVCKWGTQGGTTVNDYSLGDEGTAILVGAFGNISLRIEDSASFIREYAGTLHNISASEFTEKFREQVSSLMKSAITKFFSRQRVSIFDINSYLFDIARAAQEDLDRYFERFGIKITDFSVASISPREDDPNYAEIKAMKTKAASSDIASRAEARRLARMGVNYQTERQLDVMQTAAGNEGASGNMMGAGLGMGMGMAMGGVMGTAMGQTAGAMQPAAQTAPPPLPGATMFHVYVNGAQAGPYALQQLQQLAQQGMLTPDTLVWKQGLPNWVAASTCPDLIMIFQQHGGTPPPPPMP